MPILRMWAVGMGVGELTFKSAHEYFAGGMW